MFNISYHGRAVRVLLLLSLVLPALVFVAVLLADIGQAPAQVQTYEYIGPAFSLSDCEMYHLSPPCIAGGSLTGSVTFDGVASGYTGSVAASQITAWTMNANGVASLGTGNYINPAATGFTLTNGDITFWNFQADADPAGDYPVITSDAGTIDSGAAADPVTHSITAIGLVLTGTSGNGFWFSPKSLGKPCDHSGGCETGEPIDLGSGNVFNEVTDYETDGQNKLNLIRYYNSMASPDTYATRMGSNWRTNYDRYLHIFSYGIEAERPDGAVVNFISSSGTYTPDTDVDLKLTNSGSTWTLTDQNDTVETYTASGSKATLTSIKKRGGYLQAIGYSSSQISYVSDSYGRQLGFSYSSGLLSSVTTPDSLTLSYGYVAFSSAHQLTTVSYNTSPATHQTYLYENTSYPFALTGITDENGNRYATWGYDSKGRSILSELSGAVNYTSVSYDDTTGNRIVKGPLGIVETYKFTTMQGVPKVTEIDRAANSPVASATETISYDANGYRNSLTDWNGNNTSWINNSHGQPTQISFASATTNAQVSNLTYDFWWPHLPHTIATNGLNANFTYDSSGNNLTEKLTDETSQSLPYSTNGQTRTWTYTYNRTGEVLTAQLPRTDVTAKTTYAYAGGTTGGTLVKITDALSHATNIKTATGGGYPKKITDQNGILTTIAYSPRLWPTSSVLNTSAGNLTTSLAYDSAGNLTKRTLPDSSYLAYAYDAAHRPTSITNALSESQGITYDSAGDVTQTLWKNASSVTKRQHTATYDALGRTVTDVGGMSQSTAFTHDSNGNVLTITDPISHVTTQTFDQLNRLSTTKDPENALSSIKYDSHSRPLTVTDPRGRQTTFVYDGFGDAIQQNSPDTLKTITYYDGDSNLTGRNQSGLNFSSATYDALDRQLTRTYTGDSTLNVSLTYDQTGHGDGIGRLTSATDQPGSLSRSYDERGDIITDARTIAGRLYSTAYTYESAGRLSGITYASAGWKVAYTRDSAGQITAVTDTQPSHGATNLATSVTHMPFGPLASMTWGNGVTDARTFDLDYRMTGVKDAGTSNIQYLSYSYNAANNVTGITDNVTAGDDQTLTYDRDDRLKSAIGAYGTVSSITYDSNSNRLAYGTTSYVIPGLSNRMSKSGTSAISYISTGNMSAIGSAALTYYKSNQLATAKPSTNTSTYYYDAFGQRLKIKTTGTEFSTDIYDLTGDMLEETNAGVETDYAYLDGMPLSAIQTAAATISALHTDNLATVQRATNAAKTIVWTGNYDPNGAVTPTTTITMNQRQLGVYADSTGYYHNGARDRAPASALIPGYVESDPIGIVPWIMFQVGTPNTYPWLQYNPYKNTDRYGLAPNLFQFVIGAGIGGFAGYRAPATSTLNRVIDTGIGAAAGGVAAMVSPRLSGAAAEAAGPVAGFFTAEAVGGASAVTGGLSINYVNGYPLGYDLDYALAIGLGAPLLSGESLLIGSGYLGESSIGAANALALNTAVFGSIGILADPLINPPETSGLAGPPAPYGGGILINSSGFSFE